MDLRERVSQKNFIESLFIKAIESNNSKFKIKIGFLNKTAQSIAEELCATTNFEFFIKFKV